MSEKVLLTSSANVNFTEFMFRNYYKNSPFLNLCCNKLSIFIIINKIIKILNLLQHKFKEWELVCYKHPYQLRFIVCYIHYEMLCILLKT